jgi:hypothetical protein
VKRAVLIAAITLLLGAVGIQFARGFWRKAEINKGARLELMPRALPGWTVAEVPLGATEAVSSATKSTLRFTDVLNREYTHGRVRLGIYIAYWESGKQPRRWVTGHTPDHCWSTQGWSCAEMRFNETVSAKTIPSLSAAQFRHFKTPAQQDVYVLYWALMGSAPYDFGNRFNDHPSMTRWWRDAIDDVIHGYSEQYFIRITSNVPFAEVWAQPGVGQIVQALTSLGLGVNASGTDKGI